MKNPASNIQNVKPFVHLGTLSIFLGITGLPPVYGGINWKGTSTKIFPQKVSTYMQSILAKDTFFFF